MPSFACVVLIDAAGRLLLQERDEHPLIDPERWGMTGGHVDVDESFESAAYRELAEETGIELAPGSLTSYGAFEVWHEAYASQDQVQVFVGRVDLTNDDVECREGRQIVFVPPERLPDLALTASATMVLPKFLKSDAYRELCR